MHNGPLEVQKEDSHGRQRTSGEFSDAELYPVR